MGEELLLGRGGFPVYPGESRDLDAFVKEMVIKVDVQQPTGTTLDLSSVYPQQKDKHIGATLTLDQPREKVENLGSRSHMDDGSSGTNLLAFPWRLVDGVGPLHVLFLSCPFRHGAFQPERISTRRRLCSSLS